MMRSIACSLASQIKAFLCMADRSSKHLPVCTYLIDIAKNKCMYKYFICNNSSGSVIRQCLKQRKSFGNIYREANLVINSFAIGSRRIL